MTRARACASLLLSLCASLAPGCGGAEHAGSDAGPAAAPEPPRYLAFQMFTYAPGADTSVLFAGSRVEADIDELVARLGGELGSGDRRLAFALGPFTFDHPDDAWRRDIAEGFRIARRSGVAVVFHIDDSMMWSARTDLTSSHDNVEWTDWAGTVHPARVIGWLPGIRLAPPMCYESPGLRAEVSRLATEVIGPAIADGLAALRVESREDLFAGVIAGWETRLDDDSQPPVTIGFCSLTHRGFSAASPPEDPDAELEDVVHRWASHWTEQLAAAGVPEALIYTHFAIDDAEPSAVHAPPDAAFPARGRAGFSAYADSLPKIVDGSVSAALERRGTPRWAMAEGTNVMLGSAFDGDGESSPIAWERYLGGLLAADASLVNIFAWQDLSGVFGRATRSDAAIAAYLRFLRGDELPIPTAEDLELLSRMPELRPGPPSEHDPTELEVVEATATLVELRFTNNAPDASVFVLQRCGGADCDDFAIVNGHPAAMGPTISDPTVASGAAYRYRVFVVRDTTPSGASNVVDVIVP